MNMNKKSLVEVQDKKIILSILWIFVMFCIAYADIIGFIEPGTLENIINGNLGFDITPTMILVVSLIRALPIAMIVISRLFSRGVSRWLNIVASVLTLLYVIGGANWESTSYPVFLALEVAALLVIIWQVWTWRSPES